MALINERQKAKEAFDKLNAFAQVKSDKRGMVITLPGSVLFATGKSTLMPNARKNLDQVADALKEVEGRKVRIIGHTDSTGADSYNQALSERRAGSVASYLQAQGVQPVRFLVVGYGETRPIADNSTEGGRSQNRRVEITLVPVTG